MATRIDKYTHIHVLTGTLIYINLQYSLNVIDTF